MEIDSWWGDIGTRKEILKALDSAYSEDIPHSTLINVNKKKCELLVARDSYKLSIPSCIGYMMFTSEINIRHYR